MKATLFSAIQRIVPTFILLICIFYTGTAGTQKIYTGDKLSSSLTYCITQDAYGYLWVGTEHGLNRFDGYNFVQYFHDEKDSTSIPDDDIASLLCDRDGQLWVGTNKGLCRYDQETNSFVRYRIPKVTPRISCICQRANGHLLIGTGGHGLFIYDNQKNRLFKALEIKRYPHDDFYTKLFEDRNEDIWRASHINTLTHIRMRNDRPAGIKEYSIKCGEVVQFLKTDESGFIIVCTHGILKYDYTTRQLNDANYDLSIIPTGCSIQSATIDVKGDICIGTSGQGSYYIPAGTNKLLLPPIYKQKNFIQNADINFIFNDRNHNLWLSCHTEGLVQENMSVNVFHSWRESDAVKPEIATVIEGRREFLYNLRQQFNSMNIRTAINGGNGIFYISDYGKGLIIYDSETGKTERLSMFQTSRRNGYLTNDWIKTFYIDSHKMLWIGTSNGISCMDTKDKSFNKYGWNTIMQDKNCTALGEDLVGNIIIGTDKGLYIYNRKDNHVSEFPHAGQLKKLIICGILCDKDGDLWISTSRGIWQWSQSHSEFISHVNGNGLVSREYIPNTSYKLPDGNLCFGISNGFTVFNPIDVKHSASDLGKVYLTNITIGNRSLGCTKDYYEVDNHEGWFTLEYSLLNFKNTDDITFQYRVNDSEEWISLPEGSNIISFNHMESGTHTIETRALCNGAYSSENNIIKIKVSPPWYLSLWGIIMNSLIIIGLIALGFYFYERKRKADMDEQKMQFLINATHDIRSPLTLILGPLKKLRERISDAESQNDIKTIDSNAQRLLQLVNQILDERKIDKNQMRLKCQETDIVSFIGRICHLYEYNALERRITFSIEPTEKHIMAWIDHINFDKVVNNLLSNAFKYTFDGGEISVRIFTQHTKKKKQDVEEFVMQIIDNGMGLKTDNPERLFERFYQGDNIREYHVEGTGIGLNLSRAIVNMHGGTITAANRSDGIRGSVFTVSIPLGNAHLKAEEIEENTLTQETDKEVKPISKKQASRHFRILIVDDDIEISDYISNELSTWYRFTAAQNGREALQLLFTEQYDLVISDIMMPQMDGIELLKNIKGNVNISDIPVILLTSKSDAAHRLEGLKKGADAYLSKPFNMEELHILIDNLVDNVRRLRGKYSGVQKGNGQIENIDVKGNNDQLMERVMSCINTNLTNFDFNVEQLTHEVGISRAQLHRKMKEITGISTADFIRNLRLEQAARLLKEGKINVSQVAYSVGFNNQTHFSTLFKKHYGMTPTEYASHR